MKYESKIQGSRRTFLADIGLGCAGLGLGSLLHQDGIVRADAGTASAASDGQPLFAPKANSVVRISANGSYSKPSPCSTMMTAIGRRN